MRRILKPVLAYRLLVCLLVLLGIQPLLRLPQEIGQLYLGVPLSPSLRGLLFVNVETASHWPGIQAGLRPGDRILGIEGRDAVFAPGIIAEVAAGRREGDPVQVAIQRGAERLSVTVPLHRFRLAEALEFHGLWFLAGLTTALAGWLLFRPPTQLMALALTPIAGLLFAHGNTGYADPRFGSYDFYPLEPMWTYGYSFLGAVLIHLAWRFPLAQSAEGRPSSSRSATWWLVGLYGLVFTMGTIQEITRVIRWVEANEFLTQVSLLLAGVGCVGTLVRVAWVWIRRQPGQADLRAIAAVWGVGLLLLFGAGIVPFWSSDVGMLLAQFLLSIAVVYPLLLVYAVRQVELVERLEHEAEEKQRWADLAQELQQFREEDLRRVANELHDTVLSNLRAVELFLERLTPTARAPTTESDSQTHSGRAASTADLQTLRETVYQIRQQARQVMIGAMPLDFHKVGLREALEEALERFQRMAPEVEARLEVGPFDAEPPPAVREAAYWIAVSALNNCREHAQASKVRVFVSAEGGHVQMMIRDDGVGFQGAREQGGRGARGQRGGGERGLGLRNMRARAAEVGGDLVIESGSRGTTVRFSLTLPQERPIRLLVVEDSEAFVAGLRTALERWAHEIEIAGVAASTQEALAMAQTLQPDIVLLDLRIRESSEAEETNARHGLRVLLGLSQMPRIRSMIMSFAHDPAWLRAASEIGAWAFWSKDEDVTSLVGLLRQVAAGEPALTAEQWAEVEKKRLVETLSPREWEVLLFLEQGLANQEIADRLEISVRTVEKHVENVLGKLGVHSRLEAVARARELGLLSADRPEFPPLDLMV